MTSETPTFTPTPALGAAAVAGSSSRPGPRQRPGTSRMTSIVSQVLLSLVALVFLVPIIWMVLSALKPSAEVFTVPPKLFGSEVKFGNFVEAWNFLPFGRFILNTLFVAGLGTLITLVASALSAYAFARLNFRFQGGLFVLYLSTLIVPQEVIVIPMFLVMQQLGWVNSYKALILPWAFTAFGTFLLRQFFITIPKELEEAAKIDGCGHLRILRLIILPVAAPALAVLAVFTFISYWNSFLWPLIIVNDTNKMTVPLGLQLFLGQQGQRWELLMAAATISMVPTVILVLSLQKYLVKGIALSGLGGR
jgi:multiple sugar transport system permease protein